MSELYYFSPEQKEIAQRTDLVELLRSQGETLKPSGSEFEWKYLLCGDEVIVINMVLIIYLCQADKQLVVIGHMLGCGTC